MLPILGAGLELLFLIKGFWRWPGIEPFVEDPLVFEKDGVRTLEK